MRLTHPDTRRTITVREDMADIYLSQGWMPGTGPAKKAATKRVAAKAAAIVPPTPPPSE